MQLQTEKFTSISRGVEEQYNYQVANSPKIMSMLGDMLYKDKILAPIRELTANAVDAHIEAGTIDKPIQFTIPFIYDDTPTFKIRDYGCGMSEEKMVKLYRIYGLSDKDGDNSRTGCLGIGSKSPLCYSDSFTTISYYNGKKYIYVNTKMPNGVPCLQKMGECTTNEDNGVEISFPIKSSDINQFKQKLAKVLKRCTIPYKCNIDLNISKVNNDVLIEGDGWKVLNSGNNGAVAIMGGIEYPIDIYQFSGDNYKMLNMQIELFFNIGEIEMDISREGLQYNTYTINAINKKLDSIKAALLNLIQEKINTADCLYDARILRYNLDRKFDWIIKGNTLLWKNQKVNSYSDVCDKLKSNNKFTDALYLYKQSYGSGKIRYVNVANKYTFNLDTKLIVIVNDTDKNLRIKVGHYLRNTTKYDSALVINKESIKECVDLLGVPEDRLIYLSKMDKPPKNTYVNNTKSYTARKITGLSKNNLKSYNIDIANSNINKKLGKQYYIIASRNTFKFGNEIDYKTFINIINSANNINIKIPDVVYVVQPSRKNDVDRWGWTNLYDYTVKECQYIIDNTNKKKLAFGFQIISTIHDLNFLFSYDNLINNGLFKKYIKFTNYIRKITRDSSSLIELCNNLQIDTTNLVKEFKIDFGQIERRIYSKYPMLKILGDIYYKDEPVAQKIIEYINFIDSLEKNKK